MSSHHNVNGEDPEDYELLLPSEQTEQSMGKEEQFLKAEGRATDTYARISATVSFRLTSRIPMSHRGRAASLGCYCRTSRLTLWTFVDLAEVENA